MLPKGTLGPGILGQDQFEKEKFQTTAGRGIFGPGITGEPAQPPEPPPPPPPIDFPALSVNSLRSELIGNPAFLDAAIEAEFERDPEPRRGALKLFIEIAVQESRTELLPRLEEALG